MAELIVVGFQKDRYKASEVLDILKKMNQSSVVDLNDAVAVYRDHSGDLLIEQSYQMTTGEGAGWGSLLGIIIGGLIAVPFTAGASAAAAVAAGTLGGATLGAGVGALDAKSIKKDFGLTEDFVRDVGGMVQTGDSAIVALLRTLDPDRVAEQFRGYGGTVLRSTLSADQQGRIEKMLHGH